MKFRRISIAFAATSLAMLSFPAVASAATTTASDPVGDTSSPTNDITSVSTTVDLDKVSVAITTTAPLPALSDPSWATDANTSGRGLEVDMRLDNEPGDELPFFYVNGQGSAVLDDGDKLCDATTNISANVITVTAPADCIDYAGDVSAVTRLGKTNATTANDVDVAVQNGATGDAKGVRAIGNGGYWLAASDGGVFAFGNAGFYGSAGSISLNKPIVGIAGSLSHQGYLLAASDGGVFAYGDAAFRGSMGGQPLNSPIVGTAAKPSGSGYWLVASDGGVFAFGDAKFFGSMGGKKLNKPIVAMTPTPTGNGYWLVASDGGVFAFGDAKFFGSTGSLKLNEPITAISASSTGNGYRLVASDGGVFAFGDAKFFGSDAGNAIEDVVGITATDAGYIFADNAGDIHRFGKIHDFGSLGLLQVVPNQPIVGIAGFG